MSGRTESKRSHRALERLIIVVLFTRFSLHIVLGVCNVCVGHPLDLIKVQMQAGAFTVHPTAGGAMQATKPSTLGILRNVFVTEGFSGIYRGVSAPLLAVVPAFALTFWSYDVAKRALLKPEADQLSIPQTFLAGGFSGIPLAAVVGPSERIKCLMQVDKTKYRSFADCARQVYADGGIRSVYRGTGATMMRDVPGNAAYFACYEFSKRQFSSMEGSETASLPAIFMAGGLAGVANWIVAIPFDVVKSRYQTAPSGRYRNLPDVVRTLLREEGAGAFFRGLSPALLRAFPANAACLAGVETARSLIANAQ